MKKYLLNSILITSYFAAAYSAVKLVNSMKHFNSTVSYNDIRSIRIDANQIIEASKFRKTQ